MKIPFLKKSKIENETHKLLDEYGSHFGEITKPPVDIEGIIESLLGLDCRFDDLKSSLGQDVLGATWIKEEEVRIDDSLDPTLHPKNEGRYRFTLAHEVGHWQLHRPLIEVNSFQAMLFDMENGPSIVCRSTAKEPMEWQADLFAGYLLMPEFLIKQEWESYTGSQDIYYISELSYFTKTRWSLCEERMPILKAALDLAKIFKVSGQAMQIRLIGMGLLQAAEFEPTLFK